MCAMYLLSRARYHLCEKLRLRAGRDLRNQLAYFSASVHFIEKEAGAQEGQVT